MIAITPMSPARREVSLNTTRVGYLDATDTDQLSAGAARPHRSRSGTAPTS